MILKKQDSSPSAPMWMVTYGEFMTVLLCFFVALVSMGEIKPERFQQAVGSLRRAFGGADVILETPPPNPTSGNRLLDKLLAVSTPMSAPSTSDPAVPNHAAEPSSTFRVSTDAHGLRIVLGGELAFAESDASLTPQARELLAQTARLLASANTKLFVRGHADGEIQSSQSGFSDLRDLSYARSAAVANELERHGVRRNRMLLVAVGDAEPIARLTQSEQRRALNRRVEIVVTEDPASDENVIEPTRAQQEFYRGG